MRGWSESDPGAGDLSGVRERITVLADVGDHAESMRQGVSRVLAGSTDVWGGLAHDAWQGGAEVSATAWGSLQVWASTERTALSRYAAAVEDIAERAGRHRVLLLDERADASSGEVADSAEEADSARTATRALAALAVERQQAEDELARSVAAIHADVGPVLEGWVAPRFSAVEYRDDGASTVLGLLPGFSPADLHLLAADAALATRLQSLDPTEVARWWRALSSEARARLVADSPELIGNLDGVAYSARDSANRAVLAGRLASLRSEQERLESADDAVVSRDGRLVKLSAPRLSAIAAELAALDAVRSTLAKATPELPRQLVSMNDISTHPKAAIAIGDLDTADRVTYLVPGMGTTVAGTLSGFATASQRLLMTQRDMSALYGILPESLATVAWLDYDAPSAVGVKDVLTSQLARGGAHRLARSVAGLDAVREWVPADAPVALVGHSYGSTVVADTAADVPVDSLVILGSAGVERRLKSADDLLVPRGHVFATMAARDEWGPEGQLLSRRQDPTLRSFGAHVFSSEPAAFKGTSYEGVTGHGPLLNSDTTPRAFSYLDAGTTSLMSTALATVGLGKEVPVYRAPPPAGSVPPRPGG